MGLSDRGSSLVNRVLGKVERLRRREELHRIALAFDGLTTLEIGGPSPIFGHGLLSVYSRLGGCDLVNYASQTLWDQQTRAQIAIRQQFIAEAVDLGVPSCSYGGLLASHVLEHVANPLKALYEWQRVVSPGGPVLLVLPHRDHTFDHRRPVTPLEHILEDHRAAVAEDDLTHLDEVIDLHDGPEHDQAAFIRRCRDNERQRSMHHHVFVTSSGVALVERAGFVVELVTARRPHHIIILARVPGAGDGAAPDSGDPLARALTASPFASDAREARR